MIKCEHFHVQELVDPYTYDIRGEKSWQLLDPKALITLDALRKRYGPITVNDWLWGRNIRWRGLRTTRSADYSPYSQHTFGRAFDCIARDVSAEEMRQDILADDALFPHINALELEVSWLHFDVRNCEKVETFRRN